MTSRNSAATDKALRLVAKGIKPSDAAMRCKISYVTIWRALKRQAERALPHPTNEERN